MAVSGVEKITKIRKRIAGFIKIPALASPRIAPRLQAIVSSYFSTQTDPYGASWIPLKATRVRKGGKVYHRKDAGRPALMRTGALASVQRFKPEALGVRMQWGSPSYSIYHISAGKVYGYDREARRFLPKNLSKHMPEAWSNVIREETSRAFRELAAA